MRDMADERPAGHGKHCACIYCRASRRPTKKGAK